MRFPSSPENLILFLQYFTSCIQIVFADAPESDRILITPSFVCFFLSCYVCRHFLPPQVVGLLQIHVITLIVSLCIFVGGRDRMIHYTQINYVSSILSLC